MKAAAHRAATFDLPSRKCGSFVSKMIHRDSFWKNPRHASLSSRRQWTATGRHRTRRAAIVGKHMSMEMDGGIQMDLQMVWGLTKTRWIQAESTQKSATAASMSMPPKPLVYTTAAQCPYLPQS